MQHYPAWTFFKRLFYARQLIFLSSVIFAENAFAQCPANIDFETGTFAGWTCYIGLTEVEQGNNSIELFPVPDPVPGRHTMLSSAPGDGLDEFGGFPKNCPNGSGHSVKLGNNIGSRQAEGLSYDFTIPVTAHKYRLAYSYAIVIQDPGHTASEQPRMVVEVFNVTDNVALHCSSFDFVSGQGLPGFQTSTVSAGIPAGNAPVLYKDWSTNTIILDGLEGKTIRFFVKTADCIYNLHFGYAYFDVVTECAEDLQGATFCSNDPFINVTAPYGFMSYTWLDAATLSTILGTGQVLHMDPAPHPGTVVAIDVVPFPGYGCRDTLFQVLDTMSVNADAGPDKTPCNLEPVQLGGQSNTGYLYTWQPTNNLSSAISPNPIATPQVTTTYVLTVQSSQGGCLSRDSVIIFPQVFNNILSMDGREIFCAGNFDAAVLHTSPSDSIQWFVNDAAINGANQLDYHVMQSGDYYALLFNNTCSNPVRTNILPIHVDTARPGIRYDSIRAAQYFPVQLEARHFGNSIVWNPTTSLDRPFEFNPYFRGIDSREYKIEIKTASGCITVDTQFVKTYKEIQIYIPTAFSPNGDGLNDFLKPLLLGFKKINYFRIYNRWGKLLFESEADLPGWDGRFKKLMQDPQTVIWTIEAVDIDGVTHHKSGTTILLP